MAVIGGYRQRGGSARSGSSLVSGFGQVSREEDFAHDFPRQITMSRASGSVKEGKVEAMSLDIASVSVTASQMKRIGQSVPGPDGQIAAGAWNLPYALPHFRMRAYRVPELAPTSSWRSVGASSAGFFADGFLDELIHAAGADPLLERLRLMQEPVSRQVLEAVAKMSDWKGAKLADGRGRGVAFVESFGVPCAQVIEVTKTEQGNHSCGGGNVSFDGLYRLRRDLK